MVYAFWMIAVTTTATTIVMYCWKIHYFRYLIDSSCTLISNFIKRFRHINRSIERKCLVIPNSIMIFILYFISRHWIHHIFVSIIIDLVNRRTESRIYHSWHTLKCINESTHKIYFYLSSFLLCEFFFSFCFVCAFSEWFVGVTHQQLLLFTSSSSCH